jgi:hypothetical protein
VQTSARATGFEDRAGHQFGQISALDLRGRSAVGFRTFNGGRAMATSLSKPVQRSKTASPAWELSETFSGPGCKEHDAMFDLELIPALPPVNHRGEPVGGKYDPDDPPYPILVLSVDPKDDDEATWAAALMHVSHDGKGSTGQDIADGADPVAAMIAGVKALQKVAPLIRQLDAEKLARAAPRPKWVVEWCQLGRHRANWFVIARGASLAKAFLVKNEGFKANEISCIQVMMLPPDVQQRFDRDGAEKWCLGYTSNEQLESYGFVVERASHPREVRLKKRLFREGPVQSLLRSKERH